MDTPDFLHHILSENVAPTERLATKPGRYVLLVDTYQRLAAIDAWFQDSLLSQLPDNCSLF